MLFGVWASNIGIFAENFGGGFGNRFNWGGIFGGYPQSFGD